MSYNLVDPTTGELTQVAGGIDTSIIPSDASASNKLATTNSTLKIIQLSGSVNCNTLTEPGLYTASAGAVSALTNAPVNNQVQLDGGFSILVTKTNVEGVYYGMQMFIPYGSDLPFIRKAYYFNNGQYWTDWEQLATQSMLLEYKTVDTGDTDQLRSFADGKLYSLKVSTPLNVVDDDGTSYQIPALAEATFFKHPGDLTVQFHSYFGTPGIWEVFYNSNGQTRGKKIV